MNVEFSLTSGKTLPFSEGPAMHFDSAAIKGLSSQLIKSSFGELQVQEYTDECVIFRKFTIKWDKAERLVCKYNNPPGLYTRISLNKNLHEYIKGAGQTYLEKDG